MNFELRGLYDPESAEPKQNSSITPEIADGLSQMLSYLHDDGLIEDPRNPRFAGIDIRNHFFNPKSQGVESALSVGDGFNRINLTAFYLEIPENEIFVMNPKNGGMIPLSEQRSFFISPALKGEGDRFFIPESVLNERGVIERLKDPRNTIESRDELTQRGFNAILDIVEKKGLRLKPVLPSTKQKTITREEMKTTTRFFLLLDQEEKISEDASSLKKMLEDISLPPCVGIFDASQRLTSIEYSCYQMNRSMVSIIEDTAYRIS